MKEILLDELKRIELDILQQVHDLCQEQGLRYSLCGGTLLGAVRHKGYIPWDDDIDIFMPRPDYNKLIEYCKTHETPFQLLCHETNNRYGYLFGKAMSKTAKIIEENSESNGIEMGVYVDIFPLDGLADTYEKSKKLFNKTRFKRELLVAKNWSRFFKSKTHPWYYEPFRFAFFIMSRFVSRGKLIESIQKKYKNFDFDNSKYSATVCGSYRLKEILPTKVYAEYTTIEFEKKEFITIKDYEAYLSSIYGDYMQLPPEEKRCSHHMFKAYYEEEK